MANYNVGMHWQNPVACAHTHMHSQEEITRSYHKDGSHEYAVAP